MTTIFAQTFNSGASNSTDFQPPTQNPQNIGSQPLQQEGESTQINPQEVLEAQRNTDLSVVSTGQQLPEQEASIATVQPDYTVFWIFFTFLLVVIGLIVWLRKRVSSYRGIVSDRAATTAAPAKPVVPQRSEDTLKTVPQPVEKQPASKLSSKKAARRKKQTKRKKK